MSDLKARGVTNSWGSLYKSDDYIYDNIEMSMKVRAAAEEKILTVYKNFDDLKISLTRNGVKSEPEVG